MTELLTAKDVEVKAFKKVSFGGYSVAEVEDFLNQVADDLEAYAQRLNERDDQIHELKEYVRKQESMTDTIKGALIQAQKAASEMEGQARVQGEHILAEARAKAAEILQGAEDKRLEIERRWASLDQDLELRRKEVSEQAEQDIASAREEARRIVEDASGEVREYENSLRVLNLHKQRFIKDTVSLLLEFGKMVDKAQQDMELEMSERGDFSPAQAMEGFRRNLLEGRESAGGAAS